MKKILSQGVQYWNPVGISKSERAQSLENLKSILSEDLLYDLFEDMSKVRKGVRYEILITKEVLK